MNNPNNPDPTMQDEVPVQMSKDVMNRNLIVLAQVILTCFKKDSDISVIQEYHHALKAILEDYVYLSVHDKSSWAIVEEEKPANYAALIGLLQLSLENLSRKHQINPIKAKELLLSFLPDLQVIDNSCKEDSLSTHISNYCNGLHPRFKEALL